MWEIRPAKQNNVLGYIAIKWNGKSISKTLNFTANRQELVDQIKSQKEIKIMDRKTAEEKLFRNMTIQRVPEFIQEEIEEQKNFLPQQKMIEMNTWCKQEFYNWYDGLIN